MNVLVTGAGGFIGIHLVKAMLEAGHNVRAGVRNPSRYSGTEGGSGPDHIYFDLSVSANDYQRLLSGIDIVIHLAARVHQTAKSKDDADLYRIINVEGTRLLLTNAVNHGIKRFVFLSTIKVVGEGSPAHNNPGENGYSEESIPDPKGFYAESKYAAEQIIQELCTSVATEYVILRTPLVYGPGVKGNFLSLLRAVKNHLPLPFAGVTNKRSLIYVENLCSGIMTCAENRAAADKIFHISDITVSVPELIKKIADSMNTKPLIFPLPAGLLNAAAGAFNKKDVLDRLTGSLVVDDSRIRSTLGWSPVYSFDDAMNATVQWYLARM